MLLTPRLYRLSQVPDKGLQSESQGPSVDFSNWRVSHADRRHARKMLLVHQAGSVRVGEVVRYTLTYTPSVDRILPSPAQLHVKIKNTSAIPLRAAYLHGPYTLHVACYPWTFDPNEKHENYRTEGTPHFEPNLKAGGHWNAKLTVPEDVRETAGGTKAPQPGRESFTWIIEIASQVLFSTSAAVHFELLVGRDERSTELGFGALTGSGGATPGQIHDHPLGKKTKHLGRSAMEAKGIYSKAVDLIVDDTGSLWNTPEFPSWDDEKHEYPDPGEQDDLRPAGRNDDGEARGATKARKRKNVHLVVLTHGLHSNLGADMLYLKESIDKTAKQAKLDARRRRAEMKKKEAEDAAANREQHSLEEVVSDGSRNSATPNAKVESDDEEQVIVRGFSGNAVRTERGIQYLGKRLAKYVLHMTYPDQPYRPAKKSTVKSISRTLTGQSNSKAGTVTGPPVHSHSSIHRDDHKAERERDAANIPHKITSISFISHSLGGLIQTYAIAYIQKHSPEFFENIKPINFVTMAAPFLGLSNENPIYVKFALDFGLVGRTGQDLGLTWRAPTVVRSGWAQMIGGLGGDSQKVQRQPEPGSKPLLRILPSGPAHQVLKKFRNRTVYSNVVNDGIVPLRTSCLLFLDWRGLGRVEKARRENGLVGTMAGWGWSELTGANSSSAKMNHRAALSDGGDDSSSEGMDSPTFGGHRDSVPQPSENETADDNDRRPVKGHMTDEESSAFLNPEHARHSGSSHNSANSRASTASPSVQTNPLSSLLTFFKPQPQQPDHLSKTKAKIYQRSQTVQIPSNASDTNDAAFSENPTPSVPLEPDRQPKRPSHVRGDSLYAEDSEDVHAPPKTTFFESAGDLLKPPLPPAEFLIDPASRPRTIFHDRVYHPSDIPPPPAKRSRTSKIGRSMSNNSTPKPKPGAALTTPPLSRATSQERPAPSSSPRSDSTETGSMKVEEKIARAYHHDLSWRKVLVRLEPDAHNNMVVRRMFANAYGWPVIKHLVDTHFAYTVAAETEDSEEADEERARPMKEPPTKHGEEVRDQVKKPTIPTLSLSTSRTGWTQSEEAGPDSPILRSPSPMSPWDSMATLTTINQPRVEPIRTGTSHSKQTSISSHRSQLSRAESGQWSDRYLEDSSADDDDDDESVDSVTGAVKSPTKTRLRKVFGGRPSPHGDVAEKRGEQPEADGEQDIPYHDAHELAKPGTSDAEIADFLSSPLKAEEAPPGDMISSFVPGPGQAESGRELVEEPQEMVRSGVTEDMTSLPSLTGVGLGAGQAREASGGIVDGGSREGLVRTESVSEKVARFSIGKDT